METLEPIAIVGMAGLFPMSSSLDDFWRMIAERKTAIRKVDPDRWPAPESAMLSSALTPDKAYSANCASIHNFVLNSSGIELPGLVMGELDPLHQITLQVGRDAIASLRSERLPRERTRVILAAIALPTDGASAFSHRLLSPLAAAHKNPPALSYAQRLSGRMVGLPAALLARAFDLEGGAFTLDAACASSLYALKLACDALQSHQADAVLAGGVSRPDCLYTQVGFSQLQALSPSGRCAPFDESADGLVVGEGAGMLVLKRLHDALEANDNILGLIRGIGLSNDMRGNLLAPDASGQIQAMEAAYRSAGWKPDDVDLIECHGAGTPKGDWVEMSSLEGLWRNCKAPAHGCPIGSVKSNIGHLLTAAGAAGLIKVLLAIQRKQLPPSRGFQRPPQDSPLIDGPFRVQQELADWQRRRTDLPRRAAVSAFGFGGINAHLLVEEWQHQKFASGTRQSEAPKPERLQTTELGTDHSSAAAIVGMDVQIGSVDSLQDFQLALFNSRSLIGSLPENRWRGGERTWCGELLPQLMPGAYMEAIELSVGDFRIPPKEIPDILPQHLLMLKVGARALADAGIAPQQQQPRMSTVIGIDFDFEATNYHSRWLSGIETAPGRPLTAARTLGALGSMVASRLAREFQFGGASFTVSGEETAGLHALQIGLTALRRREADAVLVGAVDMAGDLRRLLSMEHASYYSQNGGVHPFDNTSKGTLPGDGAAALVLKRLDQALADGDRIYAIVKGAGCASGLFSEATPLAAETIARSIRNACVQAQIDPITVSYVETHGSGIPSEDAAEASALCQVFAGSQRPVALGSTKHLFGHTGAAAGLISTVKAALCVYHEMFAPMNKIENPIPADWESGSLHMPHETQFWFRNRGEGARRAIAAAHTGDGTCMHVVLEGLDFNEADLDTEVQGRMEIERRHPLGSLPFGLFVVSASDTTRLLTALDGFRNWIDTFAASPLNGNSAEDAARQWFQQEEGHRRLSAKLVLLAQDLRQLTWMIDEARSAVLNHTRLCERGIWYLPDLNLDPHQLAFVFPGSGNHYLGMGRDLGVRWPEIMRQIDSESEMFQSQARPQRFMPYRASWAHGWQNDAYESIGADPLTIMLGQVAHGDVVCRLMRRFGIKARAVIGYSLGEVAGLVAMGAWPDRDGLHARMLASHLFSTHLVPPYHCARSAWQVPADQPVDWCMAVVRSPRKEVLRKCRDRKTARLLIVNTPQECVIGGLRVDVEGVISALGCESVFLEGVSAVHCDALKPESEPYRDLHLLPVSAPQDVAFYSCAAAAAYPLTTESAADSILKQGLNGFDYRALIESAYADGIRTFLELGPSASCTRMIRRILEDRPHLALSACVKGEDDHLTVLKTLALLLAAGVSVDLKAHYGEHLKACRSNAPKQADSSKIRIPVGGKRLFSDVVSVAGQGEISALRTEPVTAPAPAAVDGIMATLAKTAQQTTDAHESFLNFSDELTRAYAQTFDLQNRILAATGLNGEGESEKKPSLAFNREQCLEFARGSAARVLGPEFAAVDSFAARVRLPDEPLMLVDRIVSINGPKGSLGSGQIVTEHDVAPGAWYLDGECAPVCIAVEAGQADLFLCAYMGIDLVVKGERTYRLLDATVTFHRGLPRPGETIRYDIHIDKFIRQANTHMFLFRFEGRIGEQPLITMTNGCAGFFTSEEVRQSGGIINTAEDEAAVTGQRDPEWKELVPQEPASYGEEQLDALRRGDIGACFGEAFTGIRLSNSLALPGNRMRLIHRIRTLDPAGGRFGLGVIRAEADIHPQDWFLTCHFVDDMVMPGTLMYECCAHTLRVMLQRYGWISDQPQACYEPVVGVPATLKCRGPVTPDTRLVLYEVEIKEIGYRPQPYAIADAHMYADNHRIVRFENMSMQLSGTTRKDLEAFWEGRHSRNLNSAMTPAQPTRFDRRHLETFASGKPSSAFGRPYRVFDRERFIARLPQPPFLCIDRIVKVEPEPWVLKPDGWVEAEFDLSPDAWYFRANRCSVMPLGILMEIALQPCGWLAAYMGSALKSDKGLRFRNLGGEAVLHRNPGPKDGTVSVRTRLTQVSEVEDMIIEHFEFLVNCQGLPVYEGTTYFGFFTPQSLAQQDGLRHAAVLEVDPAINKEEVRSYAFEDLPPLFPQDPTGTGRPSWVFPAKALRMIDTIESYQPHGGPQGLGYIRGNKQVDRDEWFFKAHFHQDPVCPGSLGIESFIQLLRFVAARRYPELLPTHRLGILPGERHSWIYRGQIIPQNRRITVEAAITSQAEGPEPSMRADGILRVDGLPIYHLENFGVRLVPSAA